MKKIQRKKTSAVSARPTSWSLPYMNTGVNGWLWWLSGWLLFFATATRYFVDFEQLMPTGDGGGCCLYSFLGK